MTPYTPASKGVALSMIKLTIPSGSSTTLIRSPSTSIGEPFLVLEVSVLKKSSNYTQLYNFILFGNCVQLRLRSSYKNLNKISTPIRLISAIQSLPCEFWRWVPPNLDSQFDGETFDYGSWCQISLEFRASVFQNDFYLQR